MASAILSYLPQTEGLLPKWLFLVAVISIGNSVQSYTTLYYTSRIYNPTSSDPPLKTPAHVTALSSRTFGTWTVLTALVRLYAAYNITHPAFYQLGMWTFGVAFAHFVSEWLVFGTTRLGKPLAGPLVVSTTSLAWMALQWGNYVKG
ncbi:ergosterol biosynthesis protein-like protein [Dothidotthia symphoricarpi CBS 119687]|uniref:Ergosterol biosynthesis protein-like protein n=1 Tax=Dothidotthia symphoricarpi CBS 119687 TaxID=1392245 RepID=A0A6A6A1J4_9PLEO|nr:ergosterol biosynthesis protein-like protein [Dothidotthia symphoricarpi CBS 119687]KAF2125065.1 ergosterol biosynthesis protein-like protein [Dothidotthia symphoricarpi CBS 119687]